jgi:hypothetical protein
LNQHIIDLTLAESAMYSFQETLAAVQNRLICRSHVIVILQDT